MTAYHGPYYWRTTTIFKENGVWAEQTECTVGDAPTRWAVFAYASWARRDPPWLTFTTREAALGVARWRASLWEPKWYHFWWRTFTRPWRNHRDYT